MASNAKRKTTMAKLNRESRLRTRRQEKQAKKEARRQASADDSGSPGDAPLTGEVVESNSDEGTLGTVAQAPSDA
jgi:hypothetical protein